MLRPEPRSASTGSVRVANQAGAAPKIIPVNRATTKAKARTRGDGRVLMGRKCELRNASTKQQTRRRLPPPPIPPLRPQWPERQLQTGPAL